TGITGLRAWPRVARASTALTRLRARTRATLLTKIPEEDSEDGPVDYPADGGDSDDNDSSDDDEEEEASEKEDDEHLASVDSVVAPVVDHVPSFK
ncbi:hypothetical protein Tco_0476997, partial [Tanacetum coccineum]